jgi:hypothetical protein
VETKALRYMFYGLLVDVVLVLAGVLLLALLAYYHYDGRCGLGIIFGSGRYPCSRAEYVRDVVVLLVLAAVVEFWWVLLPMLLLPPVAGFCLGWRRPAR